MSCSIHHELNVLSQYQFPYPFSLCVLVCSIRQTRALHFCSHYTVFILRIKSTHFRCSFYAFYAEYCSFGLHEISYKLITIEWVFTFFLEVFDRKMLSTPILLIYCLLLSEKWGFYYFFWIFGWNAVISWRFDAKRWLRRCYCFYSKATTRMQYNEISRIKTY